MRSQGPVCVSEPQSGVRAWHMNPVASYSRPCWNLTVGTLSGHTPRDPAVPRRQTQPRASRRGGHDPSDSLAGSQPPQFCKCFLSPIQCEQNTFWQKEATSPSLIVRILEKITLRTLVSFNILLDSLRKF